MCAVGTGPEQIVERQQLRTGTPSETTSAIADFFGAAPDCAAIGVGAFGPLELRAGSPEWGVVRSTPKPGWSDFPLAGELRRRLPAPVVMDTDVTVAAMAEQRWGAATDVRSLCYMTVGTGVGAGLILDGRPWHGIIHPEIGHIRVPHDAAADPFPGICGYHGDCLEGLASGPALEARWGRPPETLDADHPAWALEAEYIALGLATVVLAVGPERIVVGGGVLQQPRLLPLVRVRLEALLGGYLHSSLLDPGLERYVVEPALGDDAGVLGAIALAAQHARKASSGER